MSRLRFKISMSLDAVKGYIPSMLNDLFVSPAFSRAVVLGAFGGSGIILTVVYSRRGPMIYVPYAVLLGGLGFLLARYPDLTFGARFAAAFAGFVTATILAYLAVGILARRERSRRRRESPDARPMGPGLTMWGHVWRGVFAFTVCAIASAGIAFIAA